MRGRPAAIIGLLLAGAALAGPAQAPAASGLDVGLNIGRAGDRFVVKGPVDLGPREVARTVVVVDGPVRVRRGATVTRDIVVVDGPVLIEGTVRGRVVTLGGRATVTASGVVGDGIRWGSDAPLLAPGADVSGDTSKIDVNVGAAAPFISALAWWLAMTASTLALGLLALWIAPRAADRTYALMLDGGWGPALGVGFVVVVGLPLLAFVALVTLVGIPFGLGLLLALAPLGALGYVTGAWVMGRAMVGPPRGRALAFLAGWGVLRGVALVPVLGILAFAVTAMFGLGALSWALLRSRSAGPQGPSSGPESPLAPAI